MRKRILYLHGLNSSLQQERRTILEADVEVIAPVLDYLNTPRLFEDLQRYYKDIDAIVGVSAGGLVAYYLAQRLKRPCLLFNPAMSHREQLPFSTDFDRDYASYMQIVIGSCDEIISAKETLSIITADVTEKTPLEIHYINGMHHTFSTSIFEREWKYFYQRI